MSEIHCCLHSFIHYKGGKPLPREYDILGIDGTHSKSTVYVGRPPLLHAHTLSLVLADRVKELPAIGNVRGLFWTITPSEEMGNGLLRNNNNKEE